jgi:hypothetical protein
MHLILKFLIYVLYWFTDCRTDLVLVILHPISSVPLFLQGFEAIKQISWEGVIVDQYDDMNMSTHLEKIKTLSADFKMLILNSHLKVH